MSHCHHCCQNDSAPPRRRRGFFSALVQLAVVYVMLLFGGGTLINTGHPVASEAGKLIHTVLFVEPTIRFTDGRGMHPVSHGLRVLSHGFPVQKFS
jgi:hypothetical protein